VPAKSVGELVALAKSRAGSLKYASGGYGTGIHMAGELLKLAARVQILHVPYKGAGPGMTALLAGEVEMMFNGLSPTLPHVRTGRLRALAVGGTKRTPLFPELPTINEAGFDFNTSGWYGILGPRGMPRPIVAKLRGETIRALGLPDIKDRLTALAADGIGSTSEEFAALLREEMVKWAKVIKAAGLKGKAIQ
jgi:tripartite-type tricarboxylate transporter receptor subunit TctC